ncbi:hypothetical protein PIB30_054680 [Stylosanthes scabra]|uniref:Uncharacterized protein n=1 Tax=Stylosanthes scabra TaxID=79078 RepID=A0ABU6TJF6_9FABA|nr:hypothetical protein [Stylosanthes scabra]
MGFGALAENLSNFNFIILVIMELVDSFHIPNSAIRNDIGKFKVDATKVGHAFGLNATGGLYPQKLGPVYQAKSRMLTKLQKKITTTKKAPPSKRKFISSTLAKSLEIEGPKGKKILGKRKHSEEEIASSQSESKIASDSNSEKTISKDEAIGRIEIRTKKRHEAMNAAQMQSPQHAEAKLNSAAALSLWLTLLVNLPTPFLTMTTCLRRMSILQQLRITPLGDPQSQENLQGPQVALVAAAIEKTSPKDADAADVLAAAMGVDKPKSV